MGKLHPGVPSIRELAGNGGCLGEIELTAEGVKSYFAKWEHAQKYNGRSGFENSSARATK